MDKNRESRDLFALLGCFAIRTQRTLTYLASQCGNFGAIITMTNGFGKLWIVLRL